MTEWWLNFTSPIPPVLLTTAYIFVFMLVIVGCVAYVTLAERKVLGFMQVRIGPNRVGPRGLGQPVADAFKLMFKEMVLPRDADRFLFRLAPLLSMTPALAAWAVIPFSEHLNFTEINAGLLYILAMTSLGVYGVIVAGWASNSKYALLGSMRAAAQIVAYEIAMGFALVGVVMASGSLSLGDIVRAQQGSVLHWYWLPLLPLFLTYLIAGVAETNRAPFDVVEGESEIVAGFHVEYSGMGFAIFFLAEYANIILISALTALLFLGGWLSPLEGLAPVQAFHVPYLGVILGSGAHWFVAKTCFFIFCFLWFRATFPRYRYDQIMRLGWKVLLPVTLIWIFVEGILLYVEFPPWFD